MDTEVGNDPRSPQSVLIVYMRGESREDSLAQLVGKGLLAFAGVAVGLASLVYFIGTATMWFSLRNRGFDPSAAVEHAPRVPMLILGLRAVLFILMFALVGALLALFLMRSPARSRVAAVPTRWIVVGSLLLVFAASWTRWTWFGLALVVSVVLVVTSLSVASPTPRTPWLWLAVPLAAIIAGSFWQYGHSVRVNGVSVGPDDLPLHVPILDLETKECESGTSKGVRVNGELVYLAERNECGSIPARSRADIIRDLKRDCVVPYFGETSDVVYVGAIKKISEDAHGICSWDGDGIVALSKSSADVRIPTRAFRLTSNPQAPIVAAWTWLRRYGLP